MNDSAANLLKAIDESHAEVSPSTLFAVASILENAPFINGAPQNTFVPGVVRLAEEKGAFVAGDDLKSGQTKVKSVLAEFLVGAGIKPLAISSYNHLGVSLLCPHFPKRASLIILFPCTSAEQRRTKPLCGRAVPIKGDLQVVRH